MVLFLTVDSSNSSNVIDIVWRYGTLYLYIGLTDKAVEISISSPKSHYYA